MTQTLTTISLESLTPKRKVNRLEPKQSAPAATKNARHFFPAEACVTKARRRKAGLRADERISSNGVSIRLANCVVKMCEDTTDVDKNEENLRKVILLILHWIGLRQFYRVDRVLKRFDPRKSTLDAIATILTLTFAEKYRYDHREALLRKIASLPNQDFPMLQETLEHLR